MAYELRPNGNGSSSGTWIEEFVTVPVDVSSGQLSVSVFADITSSSVSVGTGSYTTGFAGMAPSNRM
ncbi:hypothetical protein [Ruegeria sp. HKCCA6837]|uniref:hypothetical protein n=1 Tax=Ruegeria sp. HKCCA6837 TaxID=2682989 RepID=UPI00148A05C9|nr:hypothetical protein [Ruegeria sp. HKCCA6837]